MKNKKIWISIVMVVVICLGLGTYCYIENKKDCIKFKKEYEAYNNKTWEYDNVKGKYLELNIEKNNPMIYLTDDNIVKELTSGTKIIYFGFPDCNWCRAALPPLLEAAKYNGIEKIYYYNPKVVRTAYEKGKTNEKSKIYEQIVETMSSYIDTTFTEGPNKNQKKLTVPTVVLIKEGKISSYHNDTVESHKDYTKNLTDEQYNELYSIYEKMTTELILCTESC